MRIVNVMGRGFWAAHLVDENANAPFSSTGMSLSDIIKETNAFMADNPGEAIIWWASTTAARDSRIRRPNWDNSRRTTL